MAARVVVVDDDEAIRRMLGFLLRDAGHPVVGEAADGAAGVRETIAHAADLVIMDWSMPVMDGVAATRELRARCPGIRVIAFSSAADPQVRDAFLAAGAARYVEKPDVDTLLAAVRALEPRPADRPASGPDEPDEPDEPLAMFVRSWPALARTHIALRGALRAEAAEPLSAAVAAHRQAGGVVILDLSEIVAIDDAALAAIDHCGALAEAAQCQLEIHDPSPIARRALERHTRS